MTEENHKQSSAPESKQQDQFMDPKDTFEGVNFIWLICLEDAFCVPIKICKFEHRQVELVIDITGLTQGPRLDGSAGKLHYGRTDNLRTSLDDAYIQQKLLQFQLCTDDDFDNRETWRRLHFQATFSTPVIFNYSVDIPEDVRAQLLAQGQPLGRQTASFKLHFKSPVRMTGDWAGVPRLQLHQSVPKPPPKDTAQVAADIGKSALSFTKTLLTGLGELAVNLNAEANREADDRKLLQAEKGVWHSHKPAPQLYEEIDNWLGRPIAAGDRFSVVKNATYMQMQASLSFSEYVAPQYPDCRRTITLLLDFVPLENGTTVKYEWVVVQELHAGSIHGPQMIRIVNNGIRHWCQVDTDPAL